MLVMWGGMGVGRVDGWVEQGRNGMDRLLEGIAEVSRGDTTQVRARNCAKANL